MNSIVAQSDKKHEDLEFLGGASTALIPILVLIGGLTWLSIEEREVLKNFGSLHGSG